MATYNTGETVIHITEEGTRYFVCGRLGHCQQGLKLEVQVQAQSNNNGTNDDQNQHGGSSSRRPSPRRSPPPPRHHSPPSPPDAPVKEPCDCSCAEEGHWVVPLITLVIILALTRSSFFFSHILL
ncbi:uncharacterized protein [Cicer arietinum]|uniref:Early nodulin-55-1-like n=1 Tax=Cicer arietinum TaxID=3827 RepID=A0A1S2XS50_CICAR|nr:early nodulin-55-1-like [Cicer arietinum]XP_004493706.2 early nodulin-55-1-like [Cicer arietinum]